MSTSAGSRSANVQFSGIDFANVFHNVARERSSRSLGAIHWGIMASRIRHCVECPKCRTRYLPGFSPYQNGSCLVPLAQRCWDAWMLYCSCGTPPSSSRWNCSDMKVYIVSNQAHVRGYGPPDEIVSVGRNERYSS